MRFYFVGRHNLVITHNYEKLHKPKQDFLDRDKPVHVAGVMRLGEAREKF